MKFLTDIGLKILVAIVMLGLGHYWTTTIYPWLQSFFYHGVKLKKHWSVQREGVTIKGYELNVSRKIIVEIDQISFKLKGIATSYKIVDGIEVSQNIYKVTGEIKDRFVTLNFNNKDDSKIAKSVFMLEVVGNGERMKGYRIFYGSLAEEVNAVGSIWIAI